MRARVFVFPAVGRVCIYLLFSQRQFSTYDSVLRCAATRHYATACPSEKAITQFETSRFRSRGEFLSRNFHSRERRERKRDAGLTNGQGECDSRFFFLHATSSAMVTSNVGLVGASLSGREPANSLSMCTYTRDGVIELFCETRYRARML